MIPTTGIAPLGFVQSSDQDTPLSFDASQTVLSQYAQSPVLLSLLQSFNQAFDLAGFFQQFYDSIWNLDTAVGFGLDLWGRILGVGRVLYLATGGPFFGFEGQTEAENFGTALFYSGSQSTQGYPLTDDAYRRVLIAKAALNITDGGTASINAILMELFSEYGNCYVQDNGDMTVTLVFGSQLSPLDYAIVTQSGVLPIPVGVSYTVEQ